MKGIVWVTIAALVVFVTARALSAERTEPVASPGYGGTVAATPEKTSGETAAEAPALYGGGNVSRVVAPEKAEEPVAKPSAGYGAMPGWVAAGGAATSRTAPTTGRGMMGATAPAQTAAESAPRRAMAFGGYGATPVKPIKGGDQFRLRERRGSAATYGPFAMRDGEVIVVGDKSYTIELVEVEKTPEQERLEAKLRNTNLQSADFQESRLMEVVDFLSREGDINIVLSNVVREEINPSVTMRLKDIPVYDVIRYVTEVCGLRFRIDDHAVFISE
jgi:hypothetical protein